MTGRVTDDMVHRAAMEYANWRHPEGRFDTAMAGPWWAAYENGILFMRDALDAALAWPVPRPVPRAGDGSRRCSILGCILAADDHETHRAADGTCWTYTVVGEDPVEGPVYGPPVTRWVEP